MIACHPHPRLRRAVTLAVGAILLALGLLAPAGASAQGVVFSITPAGRQPYFVFHASAGDTVTGRVEVVNPGATAGQVQLSAVDATTGQTSGAVYLSTQAPRRGVGGWLSLAQSRLSLAGHERRTVRFTLRVPAGSGPGQHLGGLVATPVGGPGSGQVTKRGRSTFRVNIREISIVAVQVDVPGPARQALAITGLTASGRPNYQTLLIGLANTGNTLFKGHGRVAVEHSGGHGVLEQSFALDTFVPRTQIAFPIYVRGPRLPPGAYSAAVTATYGDHHTVRRTIAFRISDHQVRQTYGSAAGPGPLTSRAGSQGGVPVWVLIGGAVLLVAVSVGGSSAYFRRRAMR